MCTGRRFIELRSEFVLHQRPITQPPVVIIGRDVTNRNICLLLRCAEINAF